MKSSKEIKAIMERNTAPLAAFVQDALIQVDGNKITKEDLYIVYCGYCKENKVARMSKAQIGRNLPKFAYYAIAKHDTQRYWQNVAINPNLDTLDTFKKNIRGNEI